MKQLKKYITIILFILLSNLITNAQVSVLGNAGGAVNYCGWNTGQAFPLIVAHKGNFPINFQTNGIQQMTLTATGNLGLGIAAPNYKYHLNTAADADVFQQFTNSLSGTGISDGFRLGILRTSLIAELRQFENANMDFFTNNLRVGQFTNTGNYTLSNLWPYTANYAFNINRSGATAVYQQFTNGNTGVGTSDGLRIGLNTATSHEIRSFDNGIWLDIAQSDTIRMRFRDRATYTGLNGIDYGAVNRIMVPLRQSDANTIPFSMMQLGTSATGAIARNWMNVGTTYGCNADAMYVGWIERANPTGGDLQSDATIAWGCQRGLNNNSPLADNFRILFLEPTLLNNPDSAGAVQGKEVFRIEPFSGNVGIGNYSQTSTKPPGNAAYIGAKLDIDGDLRIRSVQQQDTLDRVLVIDQNDRNRVKWRDVASLGGVCDWNIVNNGGINDLATGYTGACVERNVGVGISAPTAKVHVVRGQTTPAVADPTGLKVTCTDNPSISSITLYGLTTAPFSFGTYSTATNSVNSPTNAVGGFFSGNGAKNNNVGVYGTYCQPTQTNLGSFAIYGYEPSVLNSSCSQSTGFAGYFNGDVQVINGMLFTPTGTVFMSDESIKTDVASMEGATDKLMMLNPVTYHLTNQNCTNLKFPEDLQCGLVAQEIAEVFPEMVEDVVIPNAMEGSDESLTIKGVQYTELIPVLIKGFQEQNKRIQNLEEQLAACCTSGMRMQNDGEGSETINTKNITLSDKNSIVLNQNVPNPFAERTTISYNLPDNVLKAQLMFYDNKGTLINTQEIETRGAGIFNVFANDLSSGSYSYALVVDGKIIDTKTMVKTK